MIRPRFHSFITLVLITFLFIIGSYGLKVTGVAETQGQIFYVAVNGSDANPGSLEQPWATLNHAAEVVNAGETVYVRAGVYALAQQIRAKQSGTEKAWITYAAYPGEQPMIDASAVQVAPPTQPPFDHDQGAFQLENVRYIRVKDLAVTNSRNSGFTVRNSDHIELYNNKTENTFSPGIGVWNSRDQKIIGNTVINSNAREMAGFENDFDETPHEAISLGSVENFEVAYNLVHHGQKEGIDIKETSQHGIVHHNYVHHMARQGLYVDSHFGSLDDVEVSDNVVHDCQGSGFAISVEGGVAAKNISFHHNLLYDNWGTGIFFSRWGGDGLRQNIKIFNNTLHHNGYGEPKPDQNFYWITGGLYLFSDNLQAIQIADNIFSDNTGFQIGYSDRYLANNADINQVFQEKNIEISQNVIFGVNNPNQPIYAGWPDNYANIYAASGKLSIENDPQFVDPQVGNFYLQSGSPAIRPAGSMLDSSPKAIGAFPSGIKQNLWWQTNFPPNFTPDLLPVDQR